MKYVCGIDEAGRGPIAGPVTAGAVILPHGFPVEILDDSKKILPEKRKEVFLIIRERAIAWTTGWVWPFEIDRLNIHRSVLLAMKRAIDRLPVVPERILVDGLFTPVCGYPCEAIKKGDTVIPEIMAASIVAKTLRDRWMERYSRIESVYEFEKHKGYPTKRHRLMVKIHGLSPIHRRSFAINAPE
ncbi:MAG: ribonuclease HII [Spirochaetales bacterium]|nr:ribonuclease HII [Spirochaetales bacterium]